MTLVGALEYLIQSISKYGGTEVYKR
ncbi:uncharacterized protein FFB20_15478 [Fusarium fujikuroi]|nr:uncharacterized protein FFB20_15478 [Fusarium fujikuroi]